MIVNNKDSYLICSHWLYFPRNLDLERWALDWKSWQRLLNSTITSPPCCSAIDFTNDRGSLHDRLRFLRKSKRNEEFFMMHSLPKGRGLCELHDQQQISIAHWYVYPTRAQVHAMLLVMHFQQWRCSGSSGRWKRSTPRVQPEPALRYTNGRFLPRQPPGSRWTAIGLHLPA